MVATPELIDTTEMYLKTVLEMQEDGVVPMRARIVERLGHSGPTVSQTIGRMERQGLVTVRDDRRLELTPQGLEMAQSVLRRHRLAERLLISVIGLDWVDAHEEACRWEHVMSQAVEQKIADLLGDPQTDPYGNPVPGVAALAAAPGVSAQMALRDTEVELSTRADDGPVGPARAAKLIRLGEPVQADQDALRALDAAGVLPGDEVWIRRRPGIIEVWRREDRESFDDGSREGSHGPAVLDDVLAQHLFVEMD